MNKEYLRGMPDATERVEGARVARNALLNFLQERERLQSHDARGITYADLVALLVPIHMRETALVLAVEDLHRLESIETDPASGLIRIKWPAPKLVKGE
jgi:hypothetical protein